MFTTRKLYWNRNTPTISLPIEAVRTVAKNREVEFVVSVSEDNQIILTPVDPRRVEAMILDAVRKERKEK